MRLLTCLTDDYTLSFLLIGSALCAFGSTIAISLVQRAQDARDWPRVGWLFLASLYAGATIWTTYFLISFGFPSQNGVVLDPFATIGSAVLPIVGMGLGLGVAVRSQALGRSLASAAILGLSIPAMHYASMVGYEVAGLVIWHPIDISLSIVLPVLFWLSAILARRRWPRTRTPSIACMVLAIVSSHIASTAAFEVVPLAGAVGPIDDAAAVMRLTVALVALLLVCTGIACCLIDESLGRRVNLHLSLPSSADPLTGLPNRHILMESLTEAFGGDRWFKLLLIDLDHFKTINITYGAKVGDAVLVAVADRLRQTAGSNASVFRIGGDDLAMLVFEHRDSALQMADDVVIALRSPYSIQDQVLTTGCSIGLCSSEKAQTPETLLRYAEAALQDAKRRGRNQVSRYSDGMLEAVAERNQRELDLKTALDEKQFALAYQPVVDIHTRKPIGYEALIRWSHPERGPISPAEFIPLAEETGMILPIGKWVLEEACRAAATWVGHQHVAVNVSALQFRSPMFLTHVTQALAESGLPPERLEVELTETAIVSDGEQLAHVLQDLRSLGVKIAMDDFGTGYSSLSHLRDLPLDRVKIDRSFVAAASEDRNSMAVLRAVTQLGRDMGIATLGEGVETEEQFRILEELGCDAVQGYLTGRPQLPDQGRIGAAA